jgi:hypothetical protein
MNRNVSNNKIIYFTSIMIKTAFEYKLCRSYINHTDTIKDLKVFLGSKLYFQHMGYILPQTLKLLESSLHCNLFIFIN